MTSAQFTERAPGSFIEERDAPIVWGFWTGPTDDCPYRQSACRQAAEAQNHIFDSLGERCRLRIIPGARYISRWTAVGAIFPRVRRRDRDRPGASWLLVGLASRGGVETRAWMGQYTENSCLTVTHYLGDHVSLVAGSPTFPPYLSL